MKGVRDINRQPLKFNGSGRGNVDVAKNAGHETMHSYGQDKYGRRKPQPSSHSLAAFQWHVTLEGTVMVYKWSKGLQHQWP